MIKKTSKKIETILIKNTQWEVLQPMMNLQANLMIATIKKHGEKMGKTFCKLNKWFNKIDISMDISNVKDFCYAVVSLTTNDWYIGSASNGWQRWKQHILDATNIWNKKNTNTKKKYQMMNIHKCMWRTGIHNWVMIPMTGQVMGRKRIERKLIKNLQPSLNILWTRKKEKNRRRPALKYRTKHRQDKNNTIVTPPYTTFFIGNTPHVDLFEAIRNLEGYKVRNIQWMKGNIDSTNYIRMKKTYKIITGKISNKKGNNTTKFESVKQLKKILKSISEGTIAIEQLQISDIITKYTKLALSMRKNKTELQISNETIWKLFAAKRYIRKKPLRQALQQQLSRLCKEKLGVAIPNKITIRIPYNKVLTLGMTRRIAGNIIQQTNIPEEARNILVRKIRPVYMRQPNIGDIAMNFMKVAKNCESGKHKCVCNAKNGHSILKMEKMGNRVLLPLTKHRKTVPIPDDPGVWETVFKEFGKLKTMLGKIDKRVKEWNIYKEIKENIKNKGECNKIKRRKGNIISAYKVRLATCQLNGWAITYADKNSGMLVACCPIWYEEKMKETFGYDKPGDPYIQTTKDETVIIQEWQAFYEKHAMRLGPFNKKGKIPHGYILPKFKDLNKTRPIVSYYHHPLKQILNITARAITFLLQTCTTIRHLTLWNTNALVANIQLQTNTWIDREKYNYRMTTGDIKNMYTMLPPEEQTETIMWLLEQAKPNRRNTYITVKRRRRNGV